MTDYFVNYDFTCLLIPYLSLENFKHVITLNWAIHRLLNASPLAKQLTVVKHYEGNKLEFCYRHGFLLLLQKLYVTNQPIYNSAFVSSAIQFNQLTVLQWLHLVLPSKLVVHYTDLDIAAKYGYLNLFQWLNSAQINYHCSYMAIDGASKNGHVTILDWLMKHHIIKPKGYTENSVNLAAKFNHLAVLDWWLHMTKNNPTFPFLYTNNALFYAATKGHTAVLDWFLFHKLWPEKFDISVINAATAHNQVAILNWCLKHNKLNFTPSIWAIDVACGNGYLAILHWFVEHRFTLRCSPKAMYRAQINKHANIVHFLNTHYL